MEEILIYEVERRLKTMSLKEFKDMLIDEVIWRIEHTDLSEDVIREYKEFAESLKSTKNYDEVIELLEKYQIFTYYPTEYVDMDKHKLDLYKEGRDARLLNRCYKPIYISIPWFMTLVCKLMPRYIIVDRRVSDSYYSYILSLIDLEAEELIDSEIYGDMSYWGYSNEEKSYSKAYKELLERNNLTENDVITLTSEQIPDDLWIRIISI